MVKFYRDRGEKAMLRAGTQERWLRGMIDVEHLCRGCMHELERPGMVCPVCGYDNQGKEERSRNALPGEIILNGRYLIGRVLGEGGFGITYLALDLVNETQAAIKEYFPVGLVSRDMREASDGEVIVFPGEQGAFFREGLRKFEEEGRLLAHFQKLEGIVRVLDFFRANQTAYLVMEYVEGKSLRKYMYDRAKNGQGRLTVQETYALMKPVMESLAEVHKAGLIHRDISPDNMIVGPDHRITLLDFGAARISTVQNDNRSMTVMVKHGYAPEEQYRTHGEQGPWTDVYALCALMYQLISGVLPEDSIERLYQDKLTPLSALKLESPVPEEISGIVARGMAVRREGRYQTMDALLGDWTEALARLARFEVEEKRRTEEAERQRERERRREEDKERKDRLKEERGDKERCGNEAEEKRREETEERCRDAEREQREKEEKKRRRNRILSIAGAILVIFAGIYAYRNPGIRFDSDTGIVTELGTGCSIKLPEETNDILSARSGVYHSDDIRASIGLGQTARSGQNSYSMPAMIFKFYDAGYEEWDEDEFVLYKGEDGVVILDCPNYFVEDGSVFWNFQPGYFQNEDEQIRAQFYKDWKRIYEAADGIIFTDPEGNQTSVGQILLERELGRNRQYLRDDEYAVVWNFPGSWPMERTLIRDGKLYYGALESPLAWITMEETGYSTGDSKEEYRIDGGESGSVIFHISDMQTNIEAFRAAGEDITLLALLQQVEVRYGEDRRDRIGEFTDWSVWQQVKTDRQIRTVNGESKLLEYEVRDGTESDGKYTGFTDMEINVLASKGYEKIGILCAEEEENEDRSFVLGGGAVTVVGTAGDKRRNISADSTGTSELLYHHSGPDGKIEEVYGVVTINVWYADVPE